MKRPRVESNDELEEIRPSKKYSKSSPTVIDLTTTTDSLPYIEVMASQPIKVYIYIHNLNNKLKPNKVSKLHSNEDLDDFKWSDSDSSNYMYDVPAYSDFDYNDDGQGSSPDQTIDYSSSNETVYDSVDWSNDYLNE